mmetsp:Transcript_72863/g.202081  ORF Transcript_72863/g.202081 Transcript_72863/m.202081 type:complete len:233 (-) Transcript_72863:92-790(-)
MAPDSLPRLATGLAAFFALATVVSHTGSTNGRFRGGGLPATFLQPQPAGPRARPVSAPPAVASHAVAGGWNNGTLPSGGVLTAGMATMAMATLMVAAVSRKRAAGPMRTASVLRRLRLAGKEIPRNKELAYALVCAIFGIGKTTAFQICKDTGIDPHKRVFELSEEEEVKLADEIDKYTLENPLRRMYKANCQLLLEIKHRRGIRMQKGLPVRYQRSKTNNRSARVLNPWRL